MPNQTGPTTEEGKAVTRLNAVKCGVYSESPVLPELETEDEWLEHRDGVFNDIKPDGYVQEIIAERIAINSWRLRRLVRYEREQVRNRQRDIRPNLIMVMMMDGKKDLGPTQKNRDLVDRWLMDGLIPEEKELMLLMRWEGRLTRHLRLDMLHLEHMQRQRRERGRSSLSLAEPEPILSLSKDPAEPDTLSEITALRQLN